MAATTPASVLKCHRAYMYVGVFFLIVAFVSPGFYIDGIDGLYTVYHNVWYSVFCVDGNCETVRKNYKIESGITINVLWPIMATLAVLMGTVAVIIDLRQRKSTRAFEGHQRSNLVQFILLLLASFQALMVSLVYGCDSIRAKQAQEYVKFPPSTVAFGLAGLLLLINVVEKYILQHNR